MDLNVIFDAIVPGNIKEIPLIQKSFKIFIDQLNKNAVVSQRINKIFEIDSNDFLKFNEQGEIEKITDSEFLKKAKNNLKSGLLMMYLGLLYELIGSIQTNSLIREATLIRNYENSLIFKEQYNILTSEYLGTFRTVQQSVGIENAIHYIYQLSKYIETGIMIDDLDIKFKEPSNFVLNYEGSLHKYYFTEFMRNLSHPCGWTYTYTTILKIVLEDYFGIVFKYTLPRILIKNANNKYIFFTPLNKNQFLDSLREAIKSDETRISTIWQENALYYDHDNFNTREVTFKDIENFNFYETDDFNPSEVEEIFKEFDVILVHYDYLRYDFYTSETGEYKNSLVTFTNGKCIFSDQKNVYFGDSSGFFDYIPNLDNFYKFDQYFDLDCGSEGEIKDRSEYELLYTDDCEFTALFEPTCTYGETSYLDRNIENAFKLSGPSYVYEQGYDESKKNLNFSSRFSDNFNLIVPLKTKMPCYFEAKSDFGQFFRKTFDKSENVIFNCSGWEGEFLNIRVATAFSDFYLRSNLLDKRLNQTKILSLEIKDKVKFTFESSKSSVNLNTTALNSRTFELPLNNIIEFTLDNIYVKLDLTKTKAFSDYFYCDFPNFLNQNDSNVYFETIQSPDLMNGIPSGLTLFDISKMPESTLQNDLKTYDDFDYKDQKTLIYRGYEEKDSDTTEKIIMTSPKYVREDLDFEFSGDYYLVFNSENDGDDFSSFQDAENKGFISKNKGKIFLFTSEFNDLRPDSLDRASWLRYCHYLTCKK